MTVSTPALAADPVEVVPPCSNLTDGTASSCHFVPNITEGGTYSYTEAEDAYNAYAPGQGWPADLDLVLLDSSLGTFSTSGNNGTYDFTGYDVEYVAVKSSDEFWIFETGGGSAGTWSVPDGQNMSHILFFGSGGGGGIPEPSVWAMMLIGFGGLGSQIRRRRLLNRGLVRAFA
jgi:hypothetical protein